MKTGFFLAGVIFTTASFFQDDITKQIILSLLTIFSYGAFIYEIIKNGRNKM